MSLNPYSLHSPVKDAIALICDSPHSGTDYPADFDYAVPHHILRSAEDTHVEALWNAVPAIGGTLLEAHFPRSYIDLNRTLEDIDPALLDADWPTDLNPGEKTRIGSGLIWRTVKQTEPIYSRLLSVKEVQQRIDRCYKPYHEALRNSVERAHAAFGAVWHLNLHSMPNNAYERLQIQSSRPLADFVLGDRDGTTCDPAFMALIEEHLRARGYTVARNDPYKGVQLIANIGNPSKKRNSMQIEIRRPLYMDETTRVKNANFPIVQQDIRDLLIKIETFIRSAIK